jgi:hypothetical protein
MPEAGGRRLCDIPDWRWRQHPLGSRLMGANSAPGGLLTHDCAVRTRRLRRPSRRSSSMLDPLEWRLPIRSNSPRGSKEVPAGARATSSTRQGHP